MNRIQLWAQNKVAPPSLAEVEQARVQTSAAGVPHTLFTPLHYERKYAYPLIVWLHGPDANETQLQRVMPLISMRNYVAVAPRGTWSEAEGDVSDHGRYTWRQTDDDIELAEQRVLECIDLAAQRLRVNRSRVFLAGYGCGGTMALRLGLNCPSCVAGVLSLGGPFPANNRPLLRIEQARNVPLFLAHGRQSQCYPAERLCDNLRLFHVAGMSVTLRQYHPCGDEITTQMLSDMDAWIMELVTGVATLSEQPLCPGPEGPGESQN